MCIGEPFEGEGSSNLPRKIVTVIERHRTVVVISRLLGERDLSLSDPLQRIPVLCRQFGKVGVEVDLLGSDWDLHHLGKSLGGFSDGRCCRGVFRCAAPRRVSLSAVSSTRLLVLDPHTVNFTSKLIANRA